MSGTRSGEVFSQRVIYECHARALLLAQAKSARASLCDREASALMGAPERVGIRKARPHTSRPSSQAVEAIAATRSSGDQPPSINATAIPDHSVLHHRPLLASRQAYRAQAALRANEAQFGSEVDAVDDDDDYDFIARSKAKTPSLPLASSGTRPQTAAAATATVRGSHFASRPNTSHAPAGAAPISVFSTGLRATGDHGHGPLPTSRVELTPLAALAQRFAGADFPFDSFDRHGRQALVEYGWLNRASLFPNGLPEQTDVDPELTEQSPVTTAGDGTATHAASGPSTGTQPSPRSRQQSAQRFDPDDPTRSRTLPEDQELGFDEEDHSLADEDMRDSEDEQAWLSPSSTSSSSSSNSSPSSSRSVSPTNKKWVNDVVAAPRTGPTATPSYPLLLALVRRRLVFMSPNSVACASIWTASTMTS